MPFTVTECTVTTNSITITFSDTVLSGPTNPHGGDNPANYALFARNSVDFIDAPMVTIQDVIDEQRAGSPFKVTAAFRSINKTDDSVTFTFTPSAGKKEFQPEDFVHVKISKVQSSGGEDLANGPIITGAEVQGRVGRITRDVEDAISYPVLTEEVGYRPSPVGIPTGGGGGIFSSGGGGGSLGQVAAKAVSEVLGWKPNAADPKGFVGALTQAFTLTDVEGHVESTWIPRTYAVQTDLGGGITGAQASLYTRAKNALDSSLPLLDGLYPLDPEADPEYVKALREMARSQMTEIVKELGTVGLPSILRIDTYFGILLGQNPSQLDPDQPNIIFNPDQITGTLGELRNTYGIQFAGNEFNNSVEDEQDITNFRVISDYMTSLMQSWMANRQFFFVNPGQQAFFGTQLVLISRQFTTISETVNEVRFALDSVFIGPNERQTLLLEFGDLAPMFLEDVLNEVERFTGDEGPRLLRDGGKISVTNNILPVVESLQQMVKEAHSPLNIDDLPDGFKTARVRNSLDDLQDQLEALVGLIEQIEQEVPPSESKLTITGITKPEQGDNEGDPWAFSIFGNAFVPTAEVTINSSVASAIHSPAIFYSPQRVDVCIDATLWATLTTGNHDVTVTSNGQSATLHNAFTIDSHGNVGAKPGHPPATRKTFKAARMSRTAAKKPTRGTPSNNFQFGKPFMAPPKAGVPDAKTAALEASVATLQKGQTDLAQKVGKMDGMLEKIAELLEGKGSKAKHKGD